MRAHRRLKLNYTGKDASLLEDSPEPELNVFQPQTVRGWELAEEGGQLERKQLTWFLILSHRSPAH